MLHSLLVVMMSSLFYFQVGDMVVEQAYRKDAKIIVLKFDDGPRPKVLKDLLPLLEKYNVPATFFVNGCNVVDNKNLVQKMHAQGYEFENHSYCHENFKKLYNSGGAEAIKNNLVKNDQIIFKATGVYTRFFRPPFWEINHEIREIVHALGYTIMELGHPDINSLDYEDVQNHRFPDALVQRVKKIFTAREAKKTYTHIFVFHELPLTVEALRTLIPYFQEQGYTFMRLDQMSS